MNKKIVFTIVLVLLTIYIGYNYLKLNKEIKIESSCLDYNKFDFKKLEIGSIFDFNHNYPCKDWDRILILNGGSTFNRRLFFLKTGIIIPEKDYTNKLDSFYYLFFMKDKNVISNPVLFGDINFTLMQHFEKKNFLLLNRQEAVFVYEKFENPYYELYTFNLGHASD